MKDMVGFAVERLRSGERRDSIIEALKSKGVEGKAAHFAVDVGEAHVRGDIPKARMADLNHMIGG